MDKHEVEVQVTLQSGTYWLADPCYVSKMRTGCPGLRLVTLLKQIL